VQGVFLSRHFKTDTGIMDSGQPLRGFRNDDRMISDSTFSIFKQPWSRHCEPTGRRKAPPDDRLREAIHCRTKKEDGLLRRKRSSQ
jgi:hypothetical protein